MARLGTWFFDDDDVDPIAEGGIEASFGARSSFVNIVIDCSMSLFVENRSSNIVFAYFCFILALHSAFVCWCPYQSSTCSLMGFEHTQAHFIMGITYVVATCVYDPLGVLSEVLYLIFRLHRRMRILCSLSSCMVSRMGPIFHT